jgi:hypothetical protein
LIAGARGLFTGVTVRTVTFSRACLAAKHPVLLLKAGSAKPKAGVVVIAGLTEASPLRDALILVEQDIARRTADYLAAGLPALEDTGGLRSVRKALRAIEATPATVLGTGVDPCFIPEPFVNQAITVFIGVVTRLRGGLCGCTTAPTTVWVAGLDAKTLT